jgi:hypothetical protein
MQKVAAIMVETIIVEVTMAEVNPITIMVGVVIIMTTTGDGGGVLE